MDKVLEITVEELRDNQERYVLVDVREPHELLGSEGHIEGVTIAPLGPTLARFLNSADTHKHYVFICLSGFRSEKACEFAQAYGFTNVYNLKGGMLQWNKSI